jgi:2-polyprenyl-3-methyl-5-hydroxy-6-metoxy-1,4-benzoquinol methylase
MTRLSSLGVEVDLFPCPLCGAAEFAPLARHDRHLLGLQTVGCQRCGLLQTNPRPTPESLDTFYTQHYRAFYQQTRTPDDAYVATHRKDVRLEYTVRFLTQALDLGPSSVLLDYGCGEGSLFVALRHAGFKGRLVGVEPNAAFGRFASERGTADVHQSLPAIHGVDAITVNHVLEHIHDPVGLLRSFAGLLPQHGRLYIDVPDAERYSSASDLHIAHIFHFTERTLRRLVTTAGYRVELCEKHRPPHHPASVRLVAMPLLAAESPPTSPTTERAAWDAIRELERSGWKWNLRRRLAGLPLAGSLFRRIRALIGSVEASSTLKWR